MLKNNSVLLHFIIITGLLLVGSQVWSQAENSKIVVPEADLLVEQDKAKNKFENLISASQIVYQLRKTYGVEGSVILSKALWQILISYSNQQQAQNIWQTAINKVTNLDSDVHNSAVNPRYNSGQVLAQYTHGMTVVNWNKDRRKLRIGDNLSDLFQLNDNLTLYMNLTGVWDVLLKDIAKQEDIQWNEVFHNSLDLFSENEKLENKTVATPATEMNVFNELVKWGATAENKALADVMSFIETRQNNNMYFHQSIIRLFVEKRQQNYLAAALAWFAVAEQLYLQKSGYSDEEMLMVNNFIEENDAWFLSKEDELLSVNENLPDWVEKSYHQLKSFYANAGENNHIDPDLKTVYQLLEEHFKRYMTTPFRQKIRKELEVCLNISEEFAPLPQQPIDEKQFNGCINDLVDSAVYESKSRELAGSLTKVDTDIALKRALQSPPWQITNILYANIAKDKCLDESSQLVNPLEWTLASESLLWFADRWPAYMQKYPHNGQINKVAQQGMAIINGFSCLEDSEHNILDAKFNQIVQAWQNVKNQIQEVIKEYNQQNLTSGSNMNLLKSFETPSNYRVEGFKITACNAQKACGVHIELESSRALFGLFPNHLLIADQLKLGKLKLCYDNVGWEKRRSASTHLENESVANYFGHFSFSLKGFYEDDLVFERKIIDQQENLYLFGENSQDVLDTACPLSIVGSKISTKLKRGTFGLVPNRLTFLTASRANESHILMHNWTAGEEWKDKILSQDAIVVTENELLDKSISIQDAYQLQAAKLQGIIYQALLNQLIAATDNQQKLTDAYAKMQIETQMFLSLNYLLRMDDVMIKDDLHGMFFGNAKIPDTRKIGDYYQNLTNISLFISSVDENINLNREKWNSLSPPLSNSHIFNIVYQLKSLLQ